MSKSRTREKPGKVENRPEATRNEPSKWLKLAVELIVLLTVVAYIPAIRGGFIWDDDDHLTQNQAVAAPDGLQQIWSSLAVSRYYPLTLTSFWIQYRLWGLNPVPYHMVNVVLHAANAVLLFFLLRRLRVPGAWGAAAIWALHPVCVESVAWVTELKNTQSALFFFLSLTCYLKMEEKPGHRMYILTLVCGVAAMLSKPSTVMLPAVFLLIAWWQRGRWRWQDVLQAAPLFAFAAVMSVLTVVEQGKEIDGGVPQVALDLLDRLLLAGKVTWFYLGKLFWPVNLTFIYPRWTVGTGSLMDWVPLVGVIVAAVALWGFRRQQWARACLFGLGYFGLLLLPVSGLFDIYFFRYSFVADHFQYLACIGPIALTTGAGAALGNRHGQSGRRLGMMAVAVAVTGFGLLTWNQGGIYRDAVTLWHDTLAKNPGCWMARNNLGAVLAAQGKLTEAIEQYRQVLPVRPNDPEIHYNLGNALGRQGKLSEAITAYNEALRIKPGEAKVLNNLGNALVRQGRLPEAIEHFELALRVAPDDSKARNNLGYAFLLQGRISDAIAQYEQALRIQPGYVEARSNLGDALLRQGKVPEAVAQYWQVLKLEPDWPPALKGLGWVLATDPDASRRNGGVAAQLAERLCEVTGRKQADGLDVLAAAYAETGRFGDAARVAQEAIAVAKEAGQGELAGRIQERLKLYQAGSPFRGLVGPPGFEPGTKGL